MFRRLMPVPGGLNCLVAAPAAMATVAAMPAVTKQMHGHHCSCDHEKNPVLREPFHASIPSIEKSD